MTGNYLSDTHAHLCSHAFDDDLASVLKRAWQAGVTSIVAVSENLDDTKKNLALAEQYPHLFPAAGLYPEFANEEQAEECIRFILANRQYFVAIGEVGLDFWLAKTIEMREAQKEVFTRFIKLAKELNLPLNVHSRSAGKYAIEMLLAAGAVKVQLHAFDGKASSALPAVEAGYFFSIPPSVVRSPQKQKLVKAVPLSRLLLESDSPVLGPEPGKRNEPANIVHAIKAIAEIKQIHPQAVIEAAAANAAKLYGGVLCP